MNAQLHVFTLRLAEVPRKIGVLLHQLSDRVELVPCLLKARGTAWAEDKREGPRRGYSLFEAHAGD